MTQSQQKLYAYVDESGQETQGEIFLVSVVVIDEQRDQLRKMLRKIEQKSRKNKKWAKERRARREAYIRQIVESKQFTNRMYYSHYRHSRDYVPLTILSTAAAIIHHAQSPYHVDVWIDGLNKHERNRFTAGLRKLDIKIPRQARGLKDEADEFIRLADAVAGFVRDGLEGDDIMSPLYKKALRNKIIQKSWIPEKAPKKQPRLDGHQPETGSIRLLMLQI